MFHGWRYLTAMQPPVLLELREEMSTSDAYPGDLDHNFLMEDYMEKFVKLKKIIVRRKIS